MVLQQSKLSIERNGTLQVTHTEVPVKSLPATGTGLSATIPRAARHAIETTFTNYYSKLHEHAFRIVKDAHAAEDIVKDAFAAAMESPRPMEDTKYLIRFLLTKVKMACHSYLRQQQQLEKYIEDVSYSTSLQQQMEMEAEVKRIINQELARLPPQRQKILQQLYFQGLSSREVAERLNLSRQTVLNHKQRGLAALRNKLIQKISSLL